MVKGVRAEIFGGAELEAALLSLPKATARNVLRRALVDASEPMRAAAEAAAPRGPTGNLKDSIRIETKLKPGQRQGKKYPVEVFVGATSPPGHHAHLIEFGTVKMPARPFLRPVWDAAERGILRAIKTALWDQIAKAAKRAAKKRARGR